MCWSWCALTAERGGAGVVMAPSDPVVRLMDQVVKSAHDEALLANRLKKIRLELANLTASNVYHHTLAPSCKCVPCFSPVCAGKNTPRSVVLLVVVAHVVGRADWILTAS